MNIETIKKQVQKNTHNYIVGIKFVNTETTKEVINSIKRDIKIYNTISRFIVHGNILEIELKSNATPTAYYFKNKDVLKEVIDELPNDISIITIK